MYRTVQGQRVSLDGRRLEEFEKTCVAFGVMLRFFTDFVDLVTENDGSIGTETYKDVHMGISGLRVMYDQIADDLPIESNWNQDGVSIHEQIESGK